MLPRISTVRSARPPKACVHILLKCVGNTGSESEGLHLSRKTNQVYWNTSIEQYSEDDFADFIGELNEGLNSVEFEFRRSQDETNGDPIIALVSALLSTFYVLAGHDIWHLLHPADLFQLLGHSRQTPTGKRLRRSPPPTALQNWNTLSTWYGSMVSYEQF